MARDSNRFKKAFGDALRRIRHARGLTQEDFAGVSSRTYMGTLEQGVKSPTLEKVNAISGQLNCHPLTLLVLAYSNDRRSEDHKQLLRQVERELEQIK